MAMTVSPGPRASVDDCTIHILESLHERVAKLEDLWKVGYELKDARKYFILTLSRALKSSSWSVENTLFNSLRNGATPPLGEIWVNPYSDIGQVKEIEIQKEIKVSNVSNGKPCVLVMCLAKVNNIDIVLKFRQVKKDSEDFTEREAKNALKIALDVGVSKIFPTLHVMFKITVGNLKVKRTWECIGSQLLSELTRDDKLNWRVQGKCLDLLHGLHSCGYVHGDPHMGNFMKEPGLDNDSWGVPFIHAIDLDEVRLLPDDAIRIGYYLRILDYQAFMFWNNPRFSVLGDIYSTYINKDSSNHDMLIKIYRKAWLDNKDQDHEVAFGPYPFYVQRDKSVAELQQSLSGPLAVKNGTTYLNYLSSVDPKSIHDGSKDINSLRDQFKKIFSEAPNWKAIDNKLLAAWAALDPAAMSKPAR